MTTEQAIEQIKAILAALETSESPDDILIRQTLWSLLGVLCGHSTVKALWMEGVDQLNRMFVKIYEDMN